ncbi:leucine dehydrogenase [bacterium]|nr:leucine dehydrogenase [bacterium]
MNDLNAAETEVREGVVFQHISFDEHEQVVFCRDRHSGLKAIIGIHSTNLGPALGGTRMWPYASEADALNDVLRLSRGMSFKASISGLDLGGGKAVILADSRTQKTSAMMEAFGRFVESLSGRYITAEDVGIGPADMVSVHKHTGHVTGLPVEMGGSGDPSPFTAWGVFRGMQAAAQVQWGTDSLSGRTVWVQGVGHVGETLVRHLTEAGARVLVSDLYADRLEAISRQYGAAIIGADEGYSAPIDVYAPCALGATLNDQSIEHLRCSIVAGAANNQLMNEERHGALLREKGVLYAPDFLINAGGLINVNREIAHYDEAESMRRTTLIYDTTLALFGRAERDGITPHQAALRMAQERILARTGSAI